MIICEVNSDGSISDFKKKEIRKELIEFAGKKVRIEITRFYKKRSNQQNRFLFGCAYPIIQDGFLSIGYKETIETIHEFCKHRFLQKEIVNKDTGEIFTMTKSTTELSTTQMMDYISELQQFGSEYLNVIVPDPNSQGEFFS